MNKARCWLVALALLSACVTPVIPLPPPEPSRMSLQVDAASGEIALSGGPNATEPGALVFVYNRVTTDGVFTAAAADGSFAAPPLAAADGDQLSIWASRHRDDTPSSTLCMVVSYSGNLTECSKLTE